MTSLAIYEPNPATEFQPILPLYQAIDGHHAGITPHEGFRLFNALTQLLAEYHDARSEIDSLHLAVMGKRHSQAFRYFTDGCNNSIGTTLAVDCLFDLQRATCALDESFWQKVLDLTGVRNFMPTARKDEWYNTLRQWRKASPDRLAALRPVAFTEENVLATAKSLTTEKKDYFAEMVEGVFKKLSVFHKTNKAQGFSPKMVITNCLPCRDYKRGYDNMDYLSDLRKIIGLMQGRPGAEIVNKWALEQSLSSNVGEWISVDGGALTCKGFLNGNVHIQVSETVCDDLNTVLAYRMPGLIPQFKERGKTNKAPRNTQYTGDLIDYQIAFPTCTELAEMARNNQHSAKQYGAAPFTIVMPRPYQYTDLVKKELDSIFRILGAVEVKPEVYEFEFWPMDAFKAIAISGTLPDQKTHQFYPTTGDLQKAAMDECDPREGDTLLEPSIGFGALLRNLPEGVKVIGVEANNVAAMCSRLRWDTHQQDFLSTTVTQLGLFERVLMNPPYSDNRWKLHLQHAQQFVKSEGRIVVILPGSATDESIQALIDRECDVHQVGQYENAFEGTGVQVRLFTIDFY
ncbi:DUF4942 domain-containing protein [Providencia rettgeri]|uniref:DUF4942 domain-containing protein n=1 Tax=Providencia rettgeri TaxID=587 RepID=UPI001B374CB6|nr:DUF4942 domain-containing protein [Providencia rettgeri]MBQ0326287.1 DUF4942 domain-containing protein [Providencia rettgeri]